MNGVGRKLCYFAPIARTRMSRHARHHDQRGRRDNSRQHSAYLMSGRIETRCVISRHKAKHRRIQMSVHLDKQCHSEHHENRLDMWRKMIMPHWPKRNVFSRMEHVEHVCPRRGERLNENKYGYIIRGANEHEKANQSKRVHHNVPHHHEEVIFDSDIEPVHAQCGKPDGQTVDQQQHRIRI